MPSFDPTQRINQSEIISNVPSLFSMCLDALKPYKFQVPLSGLPTHLQKRIIQSFCNNASELRQLEEFNENYVREQLGDDVTEEDFDFRDAFESRWNQFCRALNPTPKDVQQARTEDPYAPYERLYSILKKREKEMREKLGENLREKREKEERAKNKTVKMKAPATKTQGASRKRKRGPSPAKGLTALGGGSRSSSSGSGSALLKNAMKSAQNMMIRSNPDNPSGALRKAAPQTRIVRRTIPKQDTLPAADQHVPKNLARSSRPITKKAPPNPLPSNVINSIRSAQQQQRGADPHVPPTDKLPARKKRKINLMEDAPGSPNSRPMFGSSSSVSTPSINSIFAPVSRNSKTNILKTQIKRNMDGRRFDENTKQHIKQEMNKLNKMGKIPKKR